MGIRDLKRAARLTGKSRLAQTQCKPINKVPARGIGLIKYIDALDVMFCAQTAKLTWQSETGERRTR